MQKPWLILSPHGALGTPKGRGYAAILPTQKPGIAGFKVAICGLVITLSVSDHRDSNGELRIWDFVPTLSVRHRSEVVAI